MVVDVLCCIISTDEQRVPSERAGHPPADLSTAVAQSTTEFLQEQLYNPGLIGNAVDFLSAWDPTTVGLPTTLGGWLGLGIAEGPDAWESARHSYEWVKSEVPF